MFNSNVNYYNILCTIPTFRLFKRLYPPISRKIEIIDRIIKNNHFKTVHWSNINWKVYHYFFEFQLVYWLSVRFNNPLSSKRLETEESVKFTKGKSNSVILIFYFMYVIYFCLLIQTFVTFSIFSKIFWKLIIRLF